MDKACLDKVIDNEDVKFQVTSFFCLEKLLFPLSVDCDAIRAERVSDTSQTVQTLCFIKNVWSSCGLQRTGKSKQSKQSNKQPSPNALLHFCDLKRTHKLSQLCFGIVTRVKPGVSNEKRFDNNTTLICREIKVFMLSLNFSK